jgi:hypothetical protein
MNQKIQLEPWKPAQLLSSSFITQSECPHEQMPYPMIVGKQTMHATMNVLHLPHLAKCKFILKFAWPETYTTYK